MNKNHTQHNKNYPSQNKKTTPLDNDKTEIRETELKSLGPEDITVYEKYGITHFKGKKVKYDTIQSGATDESIEIINPLQIFDQAESSEADTIDESLSEVINPLQISDDNSASNSLIETDRKSIEKKNRNKVQIRYLEPGQRIDKYEIEKWTFWNEDGIEIRPFLEGGLGVVYKAYDLEIGEPVVLKTYKGPVSISSRRAKLFCGEAETWIQLEKHPHIVRAYDITKYGARYYIAMEYVPGGSLKRRIGHLDLRESLQIALGICYGMRYAYEKLHMIHRDLKPDNILINSKNVAKITDFGLAKIHDREILRKHGPAGTRVYMAPEQKVDAQQVDTRADIYAFGIILHELVYGKRPAPNFIHPIISNPQDRLTYETINMIIERCLYKEPQKRFSDFGKLLEELQILVRTLDVDELDYGDQKTESIFEEIDSLPHIRLRKKADNFYKLGKYQNALESYMQLLQGQPHRADILAQCGRCYINLKNYNKARVYLNNALEINPREAGALLGMGDIYGKHDNNKEKAICFYDAAIQSDRSCWMEVTQHKAVLLEETGNYAEALDIYDLLLEKEHSADLLASKAMVLEKQKHYEDALSICKEALRLEPSSTRVLGLLAHLYDWMDEPQEALDIFMEILQSDPDIDRGWLLNRIGTCYRKLHSYRDALKFHFDAYDITNDEEYLLDCAVELERLNFWKEAALLYKEYTAKNSSSADVWYRLGKAHAELGEESAAIEALNRCLKLHDHSHARFLLNALINNF